MAVQRYTTAWGPATTVATTSKIVENYLPGMKLYYSLHNNLIKFPLAAHTIVGTANFEIGTVNNFPGLTNISALPKPSIFWRLTHPQKLF
jgi:hypothetical protein